MAAKIECRKCGDGMAELEAKGNCKWLKRVNEKGVDGIWECAPSCDAKLTNEQAVMGAITGEVPK